MIGVYLALILSNEEFAAARSMVDRGGVWLCPQRSRPFHLQPVSPSAHQNQAAGKEWPRALMMFHEFSSLPCDLVAYNAAIAACETGGVGLGVGLCWAGVSAHHEDGVLMWYVMVLAMVGVMIHAYKGLAKHTGPGGMDISLR